MAKPLQSISIVAPGFYGLNTQESSVTLDAGFALTAENCVIDRYGRLGARKGYTLLSDVADAGIDFVGGHEHIDVDGTVTRLAWNDTTFYSLNTGFDVATSLVDNGTAFTAGNWSSATLNDLAFFAQAGYEPKYYDPATNQVDDISGAGNTVTNLAAITGAHVSLSAYGRLWLASTTNNKTTVYWSNLLDGTNFDTGTAGSLNLAAVLVNGNDEITGLGAHNGRLIIFTRNNIVIYGDTDTDQVLDPATMQLVEVINGVGCYSRDSIQNAGPDILFLAEDGVRSLGRVLQEKSQPMRDLSMNVRDDLIRDILAEDRSLIKSVYSPELAAYLLLLPTFQRIYYFDMRNTLQSGANRVTIWSKQIHNNLVTFSDALYFTGVDGVSSYTGYTDRGAGYTLRYYTTYFDMDDSTKLKHVKRISATVIGGTGQDVKFRIVRGYDGSATDYFATTRVAFPAYFGEAEYNTIYEFGSGTVSETLRVPAGGTGTEIQVGFEAPINGDAFSLQKLSIYLKEGRVI